MSSALPAALHEIFKGESKCAYPTRYLPFAATMTVGGVGEDPYGRDMAAAYLSLHYGPKIPGNPPIPKEIAHGKAAYTLNHAPALWFESRASMPSIGRRFVITESGYYGLAPAMADIGDRCYVLQGARAAYILRDIPSVDSHCELIGESYIHGAMMGEFAKDDLVQWERTILV
jgi:hypothetical protein